jgi:hypothetical protein
MLPGTSSSTPGTSATEAGATSRADQLLDRLIDSALIEAPSTSPRCAAPN